MNPLEVHVDYEGYFAVRKQAYEEDVVVGCPFSGRVLGYIPEE